MHVQSIKDKEHSNLFVCVCQLDDVCFIKLLIMTYEVKFVNQIWNKNVFQGSFSDSLYIKQPNLRL